MGIVEELGSGTRKIFKYTPLLSGGKEPMIEEEDVYKVTIPMEAGVQNEKLEWTMLWDQLGLSKGLSNEQIGLFFESLMKPKFMEMKRFHHITREQAMFLLSNAVQSEIYIYDKENDDQRTV